MKRLLTSSKWGIVLICIAASVLAALTDQINMDQAFEIIKAVAIAGIGATAAEDIVMKARARMTKSKGG